MSGFRFDVGWLLADWVFRTQGFGTHDVSSGLDATRSGTGLDGKADGWRAGKRRRGGQQVAWWEGRARAFRGTQTDDDLPNWCLGGLGALLNAVLQSLSFFYLVAAGRARASCDAMRHGHGLEMRVRVRMRCAARAMRCDEMRCRRDGPIRLNEQAGWAALPTIGLDWS